MNCKHEIIKNKAAVSFDMCGKTYVYESNEVAAKRVDLRIIKEQNCNVVFEGDKICYTIKICNDGLVDIMHMDIRDKLSPDTTYERGSFRVNGECKNPELIGGALCYHLHCLRAKQEVVITFLAEVC